MNSEFNDEPETNMLFEELYAELRAIAARQLQKLPPGQTLHPTEIVHEAFGKMRGKQGWESESHFLNTAAKAMRQLLVDRARQRLSKKRGGDINKKTFDEIYDNINVKQSDQELLNVHEALGSLAETDARSAKLVELTFFLGMNQKEAAETIGISERTARRDLVFAHAWLANALKDD